jgi:hypothetical protein
MAFTTTDKCWPDRAAAGPERPPGTPRGRRKWTRRTLEQMRADLGQAIDQVPSELARHCLQRALAGWSRSHRYNP